METAITETETIKNNYFRKLRAMANIALFIFVILPFTY